ncbi:hypothetical protein [Niveibacterium sp. COAC-50]|uniref:hypothetical protein n=1 Tax=Niveibacterium sp. COAC-50 TaxID=2729384 RepID=UPI0015547306|nr:hypothetical protein [Niveibacterium sp. COAC-50]
MHRYELTLSLIDDVILSERAATSGGHRSLRHIPGGTLLGAAASRLYARLSPEDVFTVFHSGKVRFGNAYPLSASGAPSFPMPMSLHEVKDAPAESGGRIDAARTYNFVRVEAASKVRAAGGQPKQLREGYLTRHGTLVKPQTAFRLKTAIDPRTGRVAEGQLFGYESLQSGQRFAAEIAFDADLSPVLRDQVLEVLSGQISVGRSRSAQYGRARTELRALEPNTPSLQGLGRRVSLWLLSDLAACHEGVPTFSPQPQDLGLPSGRFVPEASFLRVRRYAPYNTHRRLPDLERQVISAGSVLTFEFDAELDAAELARTLAAGLGLHREVGLGVAIALPEWLSDTQPRFETEPAPAPLQPVPEPDDPLVRWLKTRAGVSGQDTELKEWVAAKVRELIAMQRAAMRLHGLPHFELAGPTRSQWGLVAAAAENARDKLDALEAALFGDNGVCKAKNNDDWHRITGTRPVTNAEGKEVTYSRWLRECLAAPVAGRNPGLAVARLAGAAQKMLTQRQWDLAGEKQ